jgi:hypothetical protein
MGASAHIYRKNVPLAVFQKGVQMHGLHDFVCPGKIGVGLVAEQRSERRRGINSPAGALLSRSALVATTTNSDDQSAMSQSVARNTQAPTLHRITYQEWGNQ